MKAKEYLTKHYNSNNENNSEFGEPNSERFKSVIELMEAYAAQAADVADCNDEHKATYMNCSHWVTQEYGCEGCIKPFSEIEN